VIVLRESVLTKTSSVCVCVCVCVVSVCDDGCHEGMRGNT
jgi:hypothetical protein